VKYGGNGKRKALRMLRFVRSTPLLKMVKELKSGLFAGGLSLPSPSERRSGGEVATRQLPETG